jgi:hypothetical protein
MSAAAPGLTKKQMKELKQRFFNAIAENDATGLAALIPRLNASRIGLNVDIQEFYPSSVFDTIQPIYPISIAIFYNALDVLRLLIASGANINIVEKFYIVYDEDTEDEYERLDKDKVFTPLRYAVYFNRDAAARMLLEAGAKYPDEEDYMENNNDNNEDYDNNNDYDDHPVGYYGMIDEITSKLNSSKFMPDTIMYILYNIERLVMTSNNLWDILKRNSFTPLEFFKIIFKKGINPNVTNMHRETILFIFARPLPKASKNSDEKIKDRVDIIKGLIKLGVNPYLPNELGETPAVRAIKLGLPTPIVDALNTRSLDNIHEFRRLNPYIVERLITKFTKRNRTGPKSYAAMLTRALENNSTRNNARIAFKPANIPNIHGRTGKNYQKIKKTQRRRAAEAQYPKRIRRPSIAEQI